MLLYLKLGKDFEHLTKIYYDWFTSVSENSEYRSSGLVVTITRPFVLLDRSVGLLGWHLSGTLLCRFDLFVFFQELGGLWRGLGVVDGSVVFPRLPQLVTFRLKLAYKHVHGDLHHVLPA